MDGIERKCLGCGACFVTEDAPSYCPDCSEAPVPMLAEVYGQIPAPAVSYIE